MSLGEFFHMGGYAFYVWTAYGITSVVMLAHIVIAMKKRKQLKRRIAKAVRRSTNQ